MSNGRFVIFRIELTTSGPNVRLGTNMVNPVIDRLVRLGGGTVERLHGFWFRPDFTRWAENWYFNENVLLLLWLALAAAAALCALRALLRRREA